MFNARVLKAKAGKWSISCMDFVSENKLGPKSGLKYGYVTIEDVDVYHQFLTEFSEEIGSEKLGYAIFSDEEIKSAKSYMYLNSAPNLANSALLSSQDDGLEYLRYAFREICSSRNNIPKGEQVNPITLEKEPKLAQKYIWAGFNGVSGYVFTDLERYKILHDRWGIGKKEVLIGKSQNISKNFVQLDIRISHSPLSFGDSGFGVTFTNNEDGKSSDKIEACQASLYTNEILDYFPDFEESFAFDIVFTQEYFGWYRRLVVSKEFAHWMIDNGYSKMNSRHFIPVKKFC